MGFGRLRVWNDDEIAAGTGFDPHPHREMEIVTYVRQGAITHRDSLGNEGRTEAGDVQVMHAGTGIVHAEYNLETVPTRLFQIWILPDRHGVAPGWGARQFPKIGGGLAVLASGREADAASGALPLYADAALRAGTLAKGETVRVPLEPGRGRLPGAGERRGDGERRRGEHTRRCGDQRRDGAGDHRDRGRRAGAGGRRGRVTAAVGQ